MRNTKLTRDPFDHTSIIEMAIDREIELKRLEGKKTYLARRMINYLLIAGMSGFLLGVLVGVFFAELGSLG